VLSAGVLDRWRPDADEAAVPAVGIASGKWDEVHYADGSTYGEKTIERAIATTSEFYDPDAGDDTADDTPADRLQTSALLTRNGVARI